MKITRKQLRNLLIESLTDMLSLNHDENEYAPHPHPDADSDLSQNHYYTKFRNELDNEIELSIAPYDCGSAGQLTITIRGPNSETENIITREEAVQLNEMLTQYLIEETSRDDIDAS